MKKITALFAVAMLASSVYAGPVSYSGKGSKVVNQPQPETCFGPGFDIGIYAAGFLPRHEVGNYDNSLGGGILAEYFFCNYVGIQGSYTAVAADSTTHIYSADLILRAPIESLCIAPYIIAGGGGTVDGSNLGQYHVGAGLDVRFRGTPIGIFADGTYNFRGSDERGLDYTLVRLGLKYRL